MKNNKFVFLLMLIVIIGVANVIWLTVLQVKYNNLPQVVVKDFSEDQPDRQGDVFGEIRTRGLTIVDDQNRDRIRLSATFSELLEMAFFDVNGDYRIRLYYRELFQTGGPKESGLDFDSPGYAGIRIETAGDNLQYIEIKDKNAQTLRINEFGITGP